MKTHQLTPSGHHHLTHVFEATLQFGEHLLGVTVGSLLDRGGLLTAAADQGFTLLLRLLAELQSIALHAFRFSLTALLDPYRFLANLLQFSQALLTRLLVLFGELALELERLLIELLAALQRFLLQLLPPLAELLLHLRHAGLVLLLRFGQLLARLGEQLFALLAALLAQLGSLTLGFLANRLAIDQLLALLAGLAEDLIGLLACLIDEVIFLGHQFFGLGQLRRQGFTHGIHQFDGVLFIHEAAAAEWHPGAIENDFLQLIELVEHGRELRLSHGKRSRG